MPYIKRINRLLLDDIIQDYGFAMTPDGHLNYFLFALCRRTVDPSYNNYKNFIGELNECVTEIRRRLLAPYEDRKCEENGDVGVLDATKNQKTY